ncbi:MAG: 4-hydroxythreonine-4-phosphate dehydrogenase PdxA [Candidatus Glassbacteria bacterium]
MSSREAHTRKILAVTLGDVRGIGPEVVAKALTSHRFGEGVIPIVIGVEGAFTEAIDLIAANRADWAVTRPSSFFHDLAEFDDLEISLPSHRHIELNIDGSRDPGRVGRQITSIPEQEAGRFAGRSVELAVKLAMKGIADAIVTAPLDKRALNRGGYRFHGHTEMLKDFTGAPSVAMMLIGGALRVTIATTHIPFHRITSELTPALLVEKIRLTGEGLIKLFHVPNPVIGLCALNPHAGEGGMVGDEEERLLLPAVRESETNGIKVKGPMPSDTIFNSCMAGMLDAVVALYHDQGMIPIKVHAFGRGVNLTLGLPFVRTSPDHGTALDLAWNGVADAGSMIEAFSLAEKLIGRNEH